MSPSFLDEFSCLREGFLNLIAGVQSVKQTGKIPKQFGPKKEPVVSSKAPVQLSTLHLKGGKPGQGATPWERLLGFPLAVDTSQEKCAC